MFHKSKLGRFGDGLPCDRDGYVPERGDVQGRFNFDGDLDWDEFVASAVAATDAATAALSTWRQSGKNLSLPEASPAT
jgi:hypothetical protein